MNDAELIDDLHRKIARLQTAMFRVENENIALATANSELRTEVRELKAQLARMVSYAAKGLG